MNALLTRRYAIKQYNLAPKVYNSNVLIPLMYYFLNIFPSCISISCITRYVLIFNKKINGFKVVVNTNNGDVLFHLPLHIISLKTPTDRKL